MLAVGMPSCGSLRQLELLDFWVGGARYLFAAPPEAFDDRSTHADGIRGLRSLFGTGDRVARPIRAHFKS